MELPNIKELSKLIALCKKQGVQVFELNGMKITLTAEAVAPRVRRVSKQELMKGSIQAGSVPDSLPSAEDLLFYSVTGQDPLTADQ